MVDINAIIEAKELYNQHKLNIHDVYEENRLQKEFKGINYFGEEYYGYPYTPELFLKSDITGAKIRYYIEYNDIVFHPDELNRIKKDKTTGKYTIDQSLKESLTVIIPNFRKKSVRSFNNALCESWGYVKQDKNTPVTIKNSITEITKSMNEWYKIWDKLRGWKGDVTITFNEWIEKEGLN
jgi:hypothetical protein